MSTFYRNSFQRLINGPIGDVIAFFREKHVLKEICCCEICGAAMIEKPDKSKSDNYLFRCFTRECSEYLKRISIRKNSILNFSKTPLKNWLEILYRFSKDEKIKITTLELRISRPTLIKIHQKLRDVISKKFRKNEMCLGGEGVVVQIDESLFCHKTKYNVGRFATQQIWVFGIADTSVKPAKVYMEIVEKRSADVLYPIIQRVVRRGSIIHSDQWTAYRNIATLGFSHSTVNHSLNFVNPETLVHTQNIESYWNKAKLRIKSMKGVRREYLKSYLDEFMWKDQNRNDIFSNLLNLLAENQFN